MQFIKESRVSQKKKKKKKIKESWDQNLFRVNVSELFYDEIEFSPCGETVVKEEDSIIKTYTAKKRGGNSL